MSESFTIECPNCHARGELPDPTVIGQSVLCPACGATFSVSAVGPIVLPAGPNDSAMADSVGTPSIELPRELIAPPEIAGPAEELFAASLPQPVARGSIRPPKPKSVVLTTIVWSSISSIVIFASFMFLMGDPWRGYDAKYKAREEEAAKKEKPVFLPTPAFEDRSLEDAKKRILAMSPVAETQSITKEVPPETTPSIAEMPAVASLAEVPIDAMPAPEPSGTDPTVFDQSVASALNPENVLTEESLRKLLSEPSTYRDALPKLRSDVTENLPLLMSCVADADDDIHTRAWELLNVLATEKPWKEQLRFAIARTEKEDPRSRVMAALALHRRFPSTSEDPALVAEIATWTSRDRDNLEAVMLLIEQGDHAAPSVVDVLFDEYLSIDMRAQIEELLAVESSHYKEAIVSLLREKLKTDSLYQRYAAAMTIAHLHPADPDLLTFIHECFTEQEPEPFFQRGVSLAWRLALSRVDASAIIPDLMKMVTSVEPREDQPRFETLRENALATLIQIKARSEHLTDLRQALRRITAAGKLTLNEGPMVVRLIATSGPEASEALPDIKAFLERGILERAGNIGSVRALKDIGPSAVGVLKELARSGSTAEEVRVTSVEVLGELAKLDYEIYSFLDDLLADESLAVRTEAALAFIHLPANDPVDRAAAIVRELLRRDDHVLCWDVVERLRKAGAFSSAFLPELLELAKKYRDGTRRQMLSRMMLKSAPLYGEVQDEYLDCIKDDKGEFFDADIANYGEELIPDLIDCLEWKNDSLRIRVVQFLGLFGTKAASASSTLRDLMNSDQLSVRRAAALALSRIDPTAVDALPLVWEAFEAGDPGAVAAVKSLGPIAADRLPRLLEMIEEGSRARDAIRVIGAMGLGAKPALAILVDSLMDRELDQVAMLALSELGEHAADVLPTLAQMVHDNIGPRSLGQVVTRLESIIQQTTRQPDASATTRPE